MQAFVTGATGFVGRHLVEELLARQWQVRALVRHPGRASTVPPQAQVVYGNLSDERALSQGASGAAVVFHLGAATSGAWEAHAEATVEGTRRILSVCHAAAVPRLVLVSSIAVYRKLGTAADAVLDESAPLLAADPSSGAYARGKLEAENLARQYALRDDAKTEIVTVRPGLVYGSDRVVFPHLGELLGKRRVAIGRPSLLLPLVEVRSCVDALVRLASATSAGGHSYNIVDDHPTTRADYLAALASATGYAQKVTYIPAGAVAAVVAAAGFLRKAAGSSSDLSAAKIRERASERRYDTTALQRDAGWRPLADLPAGMRRSGLEVRRTVPRRIERVGLVGAGAIAPVHLAALRRVPGLRIAGVLDASLDAAERLAARTGGVPAFDDPEHFYEQAQPQVVHVLTPPHTHADVAREALRRGAHVLLEKPATVSLADCDDLLAAADAAGVTIGVDETVAWDPLIRRARAALVYGVLGDLVNVDVFMSHDLNRGGRLEQILQSPSAWEQRLPGGALEDLLPHPLAVVRALCGELELRHRESRTTGRLACDFPDELRLGLASGAVTGQVTLSLSARPDDLIVTVHGTRASVRVDVLNMLFDCLTPLPGPKAAGRGLRVLRSALRSLGQTASNSVSVATRRAPPPASPAHLIREHYRALGCGEPPPAPLARARADVAIARRVWPEPVAAPREAGVRHAPAAATAALSASAWTSCGR